MIELQGNIRETEKKHPADAECFSATRNGLEPSTSAVTGRRSNQLSHQANFSYPENHTQNFFFSKSRFLTSFTYSTFWLNPRPISSSQLNMSPCLHLCPIYLIVFKGSYYLRMRYPILRGASRLDAFSVYPVPTWLPSYGVAPQLVHQRSVHPGPLVLRTAPLKYLTPAPDRDRTVSRRSEPSSRTALMGEQPNPWDRLQPQDAMSRHRGAKPLRRCELLGVISLLSPG